MQRDGKNLIMCRILAFLWSGLIITTAYAATQTGQSSGGGIIACLGGGLNNLIAATADNSTDIEWGGLLTITNAQSDADGAQNTSTIINVLENNEGIPYAAQLCDNFEIDSQGNTPCQAGNICYDDWFLPAKDQLNCLFANKEDIGGFARNDYWTSTESIRNPKDLAWAQEFVNDNQGRGDKSFMLPVRCVRAFIP